MKRTALAESVRRVNSLEKANTTHLQKYAEMSRKNEAIEKVGPLLDVTVIAEGAERRMQRHTQTMHTQTLTQQSLTHVRSELTALRTTTNRQSLALASGVGVEERLAEVERRYEEAREVGEVEMRKARDESRRRKRADARIGD